MSSPAPLGRPCHHVDMAVISRRTFLRGGVGAAVGWRVVLDQALAAMAAAPTCAGLSDIEYVVFYYALADAFTICDQYFTSVISGTVANRVMGFSGTIDPDGVAGGPLVNTPEGGNQQDYLNLYGSCSWRTMPEVLQDAGISWKFYNPPDTSIPTLNDNYLYLFKQFLTNPALAG